MVSTKAVVITSLASVAVGGLAWYYQDNLEQVVENVQTGKVFETKNKKKKDLRRKRKAKHIKDPRQKKQRKKKLTEQDKVIIQAIQEGKTVFFNLRTRKHEPINARIAYRFRAYYGK